jgi:adenylyltransferase/sulfurtransferase
MATCDTAGVLGSAAAVVGGLQAAAAIRFLVEGEMAAANSRLVSVNVWDGEFRSMGSVTAPSEDCPCCGKRRFEFLSTNHRDFTTNLCGRDAVQVLRGDRGKGIDLIAMARRWEKVGEVGQTPWFIRCKLGDPAGINLTLFADGRLIVKGTTEPMRAASIYARFVGS